VALMNGEQLVGLLVEHGIGVTRQAHEIIDLDGSEGRPGGEDAAVLGEDSAGPSRRGGG
jgi:hypothetical protein